MKNFFNVPQKVLVKRRLSPLKPERLKKYVLLFSAGLTFSRTQPAATTPLIKQASPSRFMMNWVAVAGFGVFSLAGCAPSNAVNEGAEHSEHLTFASSGRPVEVSTVIESGGSQTLIFVGNLSEPELTNLSFEVPGTLTFINKKIGSKFKRGDILAQIETTNFDLVVEQARAELSQAQAKALNAQRDYDRVMRLAGSGAIAKSDVDAAEARLSAANASVRAVKASLDSAFKRQGDTTLRANFDGIIVEQTSEIGQVISPGFSILRVSADSDEIEINALIPENSVDQLVLGEIHDVFVPALSRTYPAKISEIGKTAQNSLSFPVVLTMPATPELKGGMAVELRLAKPFKDPSGQLVPHTAIRSNGEGEYFVFTINNENRAQKVEITPLRLVEDGYVIMSDIALGTQIVSRGASQISEGEILRIRDRQSIKFGG